MRCSASAALLILGLTVTSVGAQYGHGGGGGMMGGGMGAYGDADGDGIPNFMDSQHGGGMGAYGDADGDGIPNFMDSHHGGGMGAGGVPGTRNGGYDHCKPYSPCGHGQGDCDSSRDCQPGLRCTSNVGAQFGMRSNVDVCMNAGYGLSQISANFEEETEEKQYPYGGGGGMYGGGMMGGGMGQYGDADGDGIPNFMDSNPMGGGMYGGGMGGGMYGGGGMGGSHCSMQGCVMCPPGTHDQGTCQPNMQACGYNGFLGEMMESADHCH